MVADEPDRSEDQTERENMEDTTQPARRVRGDAATPADHTRAGAAATADAPPPSSPCKESVFELENVDVHYGSKPAVRDISFPIGRHEVTALIGPSGCGKSTLLRCLNRMNDLIPGAKVAGTINYHGEDLYGPQVDPVEVRKRIGMVFQKPNPFPKSIFDNIAFGPRVLGVKGDMDEIVERALRRGALWDEVKDRLKDNAFGMSGGQQQRLCIARALAVEARRDPDGRALLGAGPDLHGRDRGPDR